MQEAGLLLTAVAALVEASAGQPVRSVVLAIGSGVDRASAAAAWHAATAGTCFDGSDVERERTFDRNRCFACGHELDGNHLDPYPRCGGNRIAVNPASELVVLDWTLP
jgi:hydrogenase nickel incorporation protein HypA/HybF